MMQRREFLRKSVALTGLALCSPRLNAQDKKLQVMTVQGSIAPEQMGVTLVHEHILVDFIGMRLHRIHQHILLEQKLRRIIDMLPLASPAAPWSKMRANWHHAVSRSRQQRGLGKEGSTTQQHAPKAIFCAKKCKGTFASAFRQGGKPAANASSVGSEFDGPARRKFPRMHRVDSILCNVSDRAADKMSLARITALWNRPNIVWNGRKEGVAMLLAVFAMVTLSVLVIVSACYAARTPLPVPRSFERRCIT
jgi:hypothetical protein